MPTLIYYLDECKHWIVINHFKAFFCLKNNNLIYSFSLSLRELMYSDCFLVKHYPKSLNFIRNKIYVCWVYHCLSSTSLPVLHFVVIDITIFLCLSCTWLAMFVFVCLSAYVCLNPQLCLKCFTAGSCKGQSLILWECSTVSVTVLYSVTNGEMLVKAPMA